MLLCRWEDVCAHTECVEIYFRIPDHGFGLYIAMLQRLLNIS